MDVSVSSDKEYDTYKDLSKNRVAETDKSLYVSYYQSKPGFQ